MTVGRVLIVLGFVVLLGVPLLVRPGGAPALDDDVPRVIIITPHNEQIRYEFARAFRTWHEATYGEPVEVIYNVPGGTSEIRRMLQSQFEAALEQGRPPGGNADLVFGGGSYEHDQLKRGVSISVNGETQWVPISQPVAFADGWLDEIYGVNDIGGTRLYDPDGHWFGTALSGFGIVYNRDVLGELRLAEPTYWRDLCHRDLRDWVALVNPNQSGSVTTAFESILHRRGWNEGWAILRRAAANARYFSASSLRPPTDVSQGDAAMGVCIDFYGRYQSQAIRAAGGGERIGYVDPPGVSTIDPDPISMLRNPPHPELARRFIEFCLTEAAQALWQFPAVGADAGDEALGPERFELRRMPIRRAMYAQHFDRLIDRVDPFDLATPVEHANPAVRSFIAPVFAAMAMDVHDDLQAAWEAIVTHPAYPPDGRVVRAKDVDDPILREMLTRFDAMPTVVGPGGAAYRMDDPAVLATIKAGWLRGGWAADGLWPSEADPADALRRDFARFFRANYRRIIELADRMEPQMNADD